MSEPSDEASAVVRARRTVWVWVAAGAAIVVAAVVAVAVLLVPDDGPAPLVEDDFSTQKYGWPDVGEGQVGGSYVNGGYRILAEREADQWGVIASPTNAPTANDVRITVDARREGRPWPGTDTGSSAGPQTRTISTHSPCGQVMPGSKNVSKAPF